MRKNRINIAFLALFQLIIFLTPIGIKSVHRHHDHEARIHKNGIVTIESCDDKCVICQFDYLNFIVDSQPALSPDVITVKAVTIALIQRPHSYSFCYFQYRAPPSVKI